MKILLAGGGTMGSVSPLIAVYEKLKQTDPNIEVLFVGSKNGPEKKAVESYNLKFQAISAGKLRRYFSWYNFTDPIRILFGFIQSFFIIIKFRPNVVMVAGSFVGVPVAWMAGILRRPLLIHQQDVITGLANKLMANFATKISISYEISAKDFFPGKTVLTGNPVRDEYYSCSQERGRQIFKLKSDRPVLLVLGGGTGSQKINEVLSQSLADILQFTQVIHLTGHGKQLDIQADGYQQFEFLTNDMTEALCAADMVVSRAGMSTLSELVILHKPTILIPLPGHQEYNAAYFQKNNAAFVMRQESLNKEIFVSSIKEFMFNQSNRENLSRNIAKMMDLNGAANVAKLLLDIAK